MTRINVVDTKLLTDQHLMAEYRELPRIFTLVNKGKAKGDIPPTYRMGKGHVSFFYDKLLYLADRYHYKIVPELRDRGYNLKHIIGLDYMIDVAYRHKYVIWYPEHRDLVVNCKRLLDKLNTQPNLTFRKGSTDKLKTLYEDIISG